jgi:uroporphyrin-III C-methyltransferase
MNGHFANLDTAGFPAFEPGTVWLVGAGPGLPGLLTLLAYHALGQADVIVYDALVNPAILAFGNPAAERVYAGKRGGKPSEKQADITLKLIDWAEAGKRVLRLKGGDPFVFGRGAEEAMALAARGIRFRIVPGISAGIGGLAYAGLPVTHRDTNHAVVFLTGHDDTGDVPQAVDWNAVANAAPVVVMYMAVKHLTSIATRLVAAGRSPEERLAVVCNAALPDQYVVEATLGTAATIADRITTPAIVVLGPVSAYRETLDWYVGSLRENYIG